MLFTFLRAFICFNLYSLAEIQWMFKNETFAAGVLVIRVQGLGTRKLRDGREQMALVCHRCVHGGRIAFPVTGNSTVAAVQVCCPEPSQCCTAKLNKGAVPPLCLTPCQERSH